MPGDHTKPDMETLFRCGLPGQSLKAWFAKQGVGGLRIATYGLSSYSRLGHYLPRDTSLELLVGISDIDPMLSFDLNAAPEGVRWQELLQRLQAEDQERLLHILARLAGWHYAGAKIRAALPGRFSGLMHAKVYLGNKAALIGSANFTVQAVEGADQHETLIEVTEPGLSQVRAWWTLAWSIAWPIVPLSKAPSDLPKTPSVIIDDEHKEPTMSNGAKTLLGYWLGKWGAWALNANGVLAYPHQLQAVDWIRPDGRAYLLGDEVGLGKTFTAAFLWTRHQQIYGDKARLIYITKPSLIIDVITAFVGVLGVDEFLHTDVPIPQKTGEIQPRFSIFHAGTACWEMVADEDGRKRNKDHQVAALLKEGRYRVRPDSFLQKIQWLRAIAARKLHEQINITAVSRLLDNRYTFVSIDTLRNPENPLPNIFAKIEESALVPLVIVDESHGLGRKTQRRQAVADLVWGPAKHNGKPPILRIPGALVVYMTGTPVHPNQAETASRLGLLDYEPKRTPHPATWYEDVQSVAMGPILDQAKDRAVIRRKEGITLDGKPDGLRIFPKRLVFPFQKWIGPIQDKGLPEALPKGIAANKDVLLAIDQYVASEASHGAKLFSSIRRVLRAAREWKEIKEVIRDSEKASGAEVSFGERVLQRADDQIQKTTGEDQKRWKALRTALEAARIYENKLTDDRLENLTWKRGRDQNGNEEKQMLFTKAGWVATAYDSLAKRAKKEDTEAVEGVPGDTPEEDEETAGELTGAFDNADDMLKTAETAKSLAEDYLEAVRLNDESKVRFSMLVALLEGIASLKLWPKRYESMGDEDRFGWGIEDADGDRLQNALNQVQSEYQLTRMFHQ